MRPALSKEGAGASPPEGVKAILSISSRRRSTHLVHAVRVHREAAHDPRDSVVLVFPLAEGITADLARPRHFLTSPDRPRLSHSACRVVSRVDTDLRRGVTLFVRLNAKLVTRPLARSFVRLSVRPSVRPSLRRTINLADRPSRPAATLAGPR